MSNSIKKGGKPAQAGFNAQNWAALSLFLQYIEKSDFQYIGFEGIKLEDFHLVFEDGRKIICESKNKNININYADIRRILDNVYKHGQINPFDEILIICKKVNPAAKSDIENFKYYGEKIKIKLKNKRHKFKERHLKLLPQVRFWEVSKDINKKAVRLLTARLLKIWVPENTLEEIVSKYVIEEVYDGSEKGKILTKEEFLKKIEQRKIKALEDEGYEKEKKTTEDDVKELINAIKKPSKKKWANNKITALSNYPSEFHYVLTKLKEKNNLDLARWENLWNATAQGAFSVELFQIFEKNIGSEKNQIYALKFVKKMFDKSHDFFRERFIKKDIADLCEKILERNKKLEREVFKIIKLLFTQSITRFFYTKHREDDRWEREEISSLLKRLYEDTKDKELKREIVEYIYKNFNLISDEGKYWHYTPPSIFGILQEYVKENPQERIMEIKNVCVRQFRNYYQKFGKKWGFEGWELMGGGIGQLGSEFSIQDRYFVTKIITPALDKLYSTNKKKAWKFVLENCIIQESFKVNSNNPDFLNRAAIPILLQEYQEGKHRQEAFEILSDFIKMRKGIPWKADLIYQGLRDGNFTDKQKWNLVEVSLNEYKGLPVNVFVEQIVSDLALKSTNKDVQGKAIETIKKWSKDPEYAKRHTVGSFDLIDNIFKLLKGKNTFDEGVEILKDHITSDNFIKNDNSWRTWDVAKALARVLEEDFEKGLDILSLVNSSKKLTINQQNLICSSLNNISDSNHKTLKRVYEEFLKPTLDHLDNDIKRIENRFPNGHSRELLVQFTEKLAKAKYFDEALGLVRIFINDTDPVVSNKKDDFNYHQKVIEGEDTLAINTVRGWCAWVLQKFSYLPGRKYIPEILPLVEKLTKDENYYVRVQACAPLIDLVRNRHTHLPDKPKTRFVPEKVAEEIERIAFQMLEDKENHNLMAVMKGLVHVFSYMRTLGTKRAKKVLRIFLGTKFKEIHSEVAPLIIFYALFRKDAFPKWPWKKLKNFDDRPFKKLLRDLLKSGNDELRSSLVWHLTKLPEEISGSKSKGKFTKDEAVKLSKKYLLLSTEKYSHLLFKHIYRFVKDHKESYFEECFELWKECIKTEKKFFENNFSDEKLHEMYWWPFFYNGEILVSILKNAREKEFLQWFKELTEYPEKVLIANDIDVAVAKLMDIVDEKYQERVEEIFKNLIRRNPKYYEQKGLWKKKLFDFESN